jgi:sortase (surface protein transpeptidase)
VRATKPLITLTTCNPRWASYERYIVFGHLKYKLKKTEGKTPVELQSA